MEYYTNSFYYNVVIVYLYICTEKDVEDKLIDVQCKDTIEENGQFAEYNDEPLKDKINLTEAENKM
jgi:hypothetical protein